VPLTGLSFEADAMVRLAKAIEPFLEKLKTTVSC